MISKSRRLHRTDFLAVQKLGRKIRTPNLSLIYYQRITNNEQPARFAIVTSSKFHKRAVVRNRFRRKIYNLLNTSPLALRNDIILHPSRTMLNLTDAEIAALLDTVLSKIPLI